MPPPLIPQRLSAMLRSLNRQFPSHPPSSTVQPPPANKLDRPPTYAGYHVVAVLGSMHAQRTGTNHRGRAESSSGPVARLAVRRWQAEEPTPPPPLLLPAA